MNYIKKFNENVKVESDNLFYFDENAKSNIESSVLHLKDIMANYRISGGWLEFNDSDDDIDFRYEEYCDLDRFGNTANREYYQCYKIDFWNKGNDEKTIKYDGDYYLDNVDGFLKIVNELEDISSKISNFGYKMSFNTGYVESISIIISVNKLL